MSTADAHIRHGAEITPVRHGLVRRAVPTARACGIGRRARGAA